MASNMTSCPGNLAVPLSSNPAGREGAKMDETFTVSASRVLWGLPSASFRARKFTFLHEFAFHLRVVEQGGAHTKNPGA